MIAAFERDADWQPSSAEREDAHEHRLDHLRGHADRGRDHHDVPAPGRAGTLDRLVALDTLVAVTMCAIGTWAAFSLDTTVTYA